MVSLWFSEYRDDETLWQTTIKEPVFIVAVLFAYLYFVLKCGPAFMRDRQPYKLRSLMLAYNAFQVLFNCFMVYKCCSAIYFSRKTDSSWMCVISDDETLMSAYFYVLNKYLDLFDTVLFVLRKKQNQISFLHVFHHVVMVGWPALTLHLPGLADGECVVGGALNSMVHVIMYSYYFATIWGDRLKRITQFVKKNITQIQLTQFVVLLAIFGRGTFGLCQYAWHFSSFAFYLNVVFLGLFLQMYIQFYTKKGRTKKASAE